MDSADRTAVCSELLDIFERYVAVSRMVPGLARASVSECTEAIQYLESIHRQLEEVAAALPAFAIGAFNTREAQDLDLAGKLQRIRQITLSYRPQSHASANGTPG